MLNLIRKIFFTRHTKVILTDGDTVKSIHETFKLWSYMVGLKTKGLTIHVHTKSALWGQIKSRQS